MLWYSCCYSEWARSRYLKRRVRVIFFGKSVVGNLLAGEQCSGRGPGAQISVIHSLGGEEEGEEGGDLDPHLSLAEHSAESARCSNPALHIGWSASKQLEKIALSSTNLHLDLNYLLILTFIPGKYCLIEKEIHDTKLWNTFNDISCHRMALNNENHSFGFNINGLR